MKKIINVLDTNIILLDATSFLKLSKPSKEHESVVVICTTVLEELDRKKSENGELGLNARTFSRLISEYVDQHPDVMTINLSETATLEFFNDLNTKEREFERILPESNDNNIISVARWYTEKHKDDKNVEVKLVSNDTNMRIKATAMKVKSRAMDMDKERIRGNAEGAYTGIVVKELEEEMSREDMLRHEAFEYMNPNEALILKNILGEVVFKGVKKIDGVRTVRFNEPRDYARGKEKEKEKEAMGLRAKNLEQALALDALLDPNIKLVTLSGIAGTGKTLLATAAGLQQAQDGEYEKLLITRPIVVLGEDIGYLPGTMEEKLKPWLEPIHDNIKYLIKMGDMPSDKKYNNKNKGSVSTVTGAVEELTEQGILEVAPITYIRGRTLANQFFIIDEAQNLSLHEVKTIITRAGEGAKFVFTGDPDQIDNKKVDSVRNGFSLLIEAFKDDEIAAHFTLVEGERSELATKGAKKL